MMLVCLSLWLVFVKSTTWEDVTNILNNGITSKIYPGYVALVGYRNGSVLYEKSGGHFVYPGDNPPPYDNTNPSMQIDTHFDMASITKLLSTTSSVLKLIENKTYISSLFDPITKYLGPSFAVHNKSYIRIINCLLHNAGFHPDPVPYWYNTPQFGCPQSSQYHPVLTFNCTTPIYNDVLAQPLQYNTGTKMVYSDLSMMTLSFVIGTIVKYHQIVKDSELVPPCFADGMDASIICYFEAFVRTHIFTGLNMSNTGFLASLYSSIQATSAPTCNSTTTFNHQILQGIVEDPNSFANGGVFGHAGIFSNILDVYKWCRNILNSASQSIPIYNYTHPYLNETDYNYDYNYNNNNNYENDYTLYFDPQWTNLFLAEYQHSLSSRALGFDTNDFFVTDYGGSHVCGNFEYGAFETVSMHTGYTGTLFCLDRERDLIYLLLTNRVYPKPDANSQITAQRRSFSNAVLQIIDSDVYYANNMVQFTTLYKQCNDTWRDNMMYSQSLCVAWMGGSLISSLAMGLNSYGFEINNTVITPSSLNQWILLQNYYDVNNQLLDGKIIQNIDVNRIFFVGNFTSKTDITSDMLHGYLKGSNGSYMVIANAVRYIDQQQYSYKMDLNRYVNLIGYSLQNNDEFIARDPLLYQMRFSYNSDIVGDYWIYRII